MKSLTGTGSSGNWNEAMLGDFELSSLGTGTSSRGGGGREQAIKVTCVAED